MKTQTALSDVSSDGAGRRHEPNMPATEMIEANDNANGTHESKFIVANISMDKPSVEPRKDAQSRTREP